MTQKKKARDRVLSEAVMNGNVSKTCRENGISRVTFYSWLNEYRLSMFEDKPDQSEEDLEDEIVSLACKKPEWGAASMAWALTREGHATSASSVYRVLRRNNLHTRERRALSNDPLGFPLTLSELSITFPGFAAYCAECGALYLALDLCSGYAWCALRSECESARDFYERRALMEFRELGMNPLHVVTRRGGGFSEEPFRAFVMEGGARYWQRKHSLEHPAIALFEALGEYVAAEGDCAAMVDIQTFAYNRRRRGGASPYEKFNFLERPLAGYALF